MDRRPDNLTRLASNNAELSALDVDVADGQRRDDATVEPRCSGDLDSKLAVLCVEILKEFSELLGRDDGLQAHDALARSAREELDGVPMDVAGLNTPNKESRKMPDVFCYRCLCVLITSVGEKGVDMVAIHRMYADIADALAQCFEGYRILYYGIWRKLRATTEKLPSRLAERDAHNIAQCSEVSTGVELPAPSASVDLADEVPGAAASPTADPLLPQDVVSGQGMPRAAVDPLPRPSGEPGFSAPAHGGSIPQCRTADRSQNIACKPHADFVSWSSARKSWQDKNLRRAGVAESADARDSKSGRQRYRPLKRGSRPVLPLLDCIGSQNTACTTHAPGRPSSAPTLPAALPLTPSSAATWNVDEYATWTCRDQVSRKVAFCRPVPHGGAGRLLLSIAPGRPGSASNGSQFCNNYQGLGPKGGVGKVRSWPGGRSVATRWLPSSADRSTVRPSALYQRRCCVRRHVPTSGTALEHRAVFLSLVGLWKQPACERLCRFGPPKKVIRIRIAFDAELSARAGQRFDRLAGGFQDTRRGGGDRYRWGKCWRPSTGWS